MLGVSSGPTDKEVAARGVANNEAPAHGVANNEAPAPANNKDAPWYARNDSGCTAWEKNAYHYECDPDARY